MFNNVLFFHNFSARLVRISVIILECVLRQGIVLCKLTVTKMKIYLQSTPLLLLLCTTCSSALVVNSSGLQQLISRAFQATSNPDLKTYNDAFPGQVLDVRLDIGKTDDDSAMHKRMTIHNLVLGLQKDDCSNTNIPMPGANGPNPHTSGGIGNLQVIKSGHFVDLTGTVKADFSPDANWELVWRQDSPAGSLLCGLELKTDAVRNSAVLPKGRIYLSFPIWNAETLQVYQERKAYVNGKAAEYLQDRDEELAKMQSAKNLFAKALHYRNAAAAVEKYSLQPVRSMSQVPTPDETTKIDDDLLLTRTGTVWTKEHGAFGKQTFLGAAVVSAPSNTGEPRSEKPSWDTGSIAP